MRFTHAVQRQYAKAAARRARGELTKAGRCAEPGCKAPGVYECHAPLYKGGICGRRVCRAHLKPGCWCPAHTRARAAGTFRAAKPHDLEAEFLASQQPSAEGIVWATIGANVAAMGRQAGKTRSAAVAVTGVDPIAPDPGQIVVVGSYGTAVIDGRPRALCPTCGASAVVVARLETEGQTDVFVDCRCEEGASHG